ncbi:MAG: phenylacetate-CoA ligase, partial [Halioglobus sp.]
MSLYTKLVSRYLFPIHERLKKHSTVAIHRQMEETQWLSAEELQELQLANLRFFLQDIGSSVPYYRELFDRMKFDPGSIASISDIQQLP